MNIVYTLNNGFVPQVGASICSVCENNKNALTIKFYVISDGISSENKKELKKLVKKYKRDIKIIELGSLDKYLDFNFDTLGWNSVILARLLIDKLIKDNIKRLLYLDGDTIVRGSLEKLWDIDMNNKIIGMSIEPTVDKNRKIALGLEKYPYYNSGVLLIDFEKWKKHKIGDKIINYYKEKNGLLFAADQDAINASMKDEIFILSPKYNFYNIFIQYPYWFLKKLMKNVQYIDQKTYDEAKKDPIIIHYLGEERPWRRGNKHKYRKDYDKYLNMTVWQGKHYEDGWRVYFIFWNLFNFLTKPIPIVRYKIINGLIPTFMKIRKCQRQKQK